MVTKSIAMKSFAEFVAGTESARARILRGYKFPDEEGMAMARYYWPAKSTISEFHNEKHEREWLLMKASELEKRAMTPSRSLRTKLLNNARSVRSYAEHFGGTHYDLMGSMKLPFTMCGVTINVTPDMHAVDKGKEIYVKFNFSSTKLKYVYVRAMLGCMSYGLYSHTNEYDPDAILFVDVPRGVIYRGVTVTNDLLDEIRCNCTELEKAWNLL